MKNADMPAMPCEITVTVPVDEYELAASDHYYNTTPKIINTGGLTKREYFAGLAMQGYCANSHEGFLTRSSDKDVAFMSVSAADALLEALESNDE